MSIGCGLLLKVEAVQIVATTMLALGIIANQVEVLKGFIKQYISLFSLHLM